MWAEGVSRKDPGGGAEPRRGRQPPMAEVSGGGGEGDVVAEGLELAHEVAGPAVGVEAGGVTGGVGEHAPGVRAAAVAGLGFRLDADANAGAKADAVISPAGAPVAVVVLAAQEDVEIARATRALVAERTPA